MRSVLCIRATGTLLTVYLWGLPKHLNTRASYNHWWICIPIPRGKRLSCNSPFQRQFIENSEKLNNLLRSCKESWGAFVSWVLFWCHNSPPWQPEPAVTGIGTDPHLDLWYWITVKSKPAGEKLLFILPRFWLAWNKSLMKELEESLWIIDVYFFCFLDHSQKAGKINLLVGPTEHDEHQKSGYTMDVN